MGVVGGFRSRAGASQRIGRGVAHRSRPGQASIPDPGPSRSCRTANPGRHNEAWPRDSKWVCGRQSGARHATARPGAVAAAVASSTSHPFGIVPPIGGEVQTAAGRACGRAIRRTPGSPVAACWWRFCAGDRIDADRRATRRRSRVPALPPHRGGRCVRSSHRPRPVQQPVDAGRVHFDADVVGSRIALPNAATPRRCRSRFRGCASPLRPNRASNARLAGVIDEVRPQSVERALLRPGEAAPA